MGETEREELSVHIKYLIAGAMSGAASRTVVAPLERTKIIYQLHQGPSPPTILQTLASIYRREGYAGFYKGNGANVLRMVPYMAVQFMAYENYKKIFVPPEDNNLFIAQRLLAGALAGMTSVCMTYPLDLVRTRLSAQREVANRKYTGIFNCLCTVVREEGGIKSGCLYRGIGASIMGITPYVALNFSVYEMLKIYGSRFLSNENVNVELPVFYRLGCGALAGVIAQTFIYPLDLVRRRMQMKGIPGSSFHYSTTLDALITIINLEGVRGLYKGLVANYLKVIPSVSISFVTYEMCKHSLLVV
eukprot:Ihof_evm2s219 gene=Ihof_evmTU2s219